MRPQTDILSLLYEEPGPKTKRFIRIGSIASVFLFVLIAVLVVRQFWVTGQLSARYWAFFAKWTTCRFILQGVLGTVRATFSAILICLGIGFVMMFSRVRGGLVAQKISFVLTEFTRGVPTLLFIYFFFFVIPLLGFKLSAFWKITLPVAISASGATAEVLRSGVNAVSKGQREAALSLGFSENRTFFKIIFPQGFRFVIPSLISELVIILKDTTFAYIVSYNDLMQNAMVLISNHDAMLSVYLVAAIIYIIINYLLHRLSLFLAKQIGGSK